MESSNTQNFLKAYVTEKLPHLASGFFDGVPDQPDFTVDQRYRQLTDPVS
jgi:hypothetical protein